MKLIKTECLRIKECTSFWSWLWFTRDYPYGSVCGDGQWFKYCGSPIRLLIVRKFGIHREYVYDRNEVSFLHLLAAMVAFIGFIFLAIEVMCIVLLSWLSD